jgi:hypothetical protein
MQISSYNKRIGRWIYIVGCLSFLFIQFIILDAPLLISVVNILVFSLFTIQAYFCSFLALESNSFILENIFLQRKMFHVDEFQRVEGFWFIGLVKIVFTDNRRFYFFAKSVDDVKMKIDNLIRGGG